jgi:hypothetical protein
MAVYGIGAMYGGTEDMSEEFVRNGVACLGFDPRRAPGLHAQLSKVKAGDVIFIKSYVPQSGLHIKAVGIVTDPDLRKITEAMGWGIGVRWAWNERVTLGKLEDHCDHLRRGSLYEEFNPEVVRRVIDLLVPAE